MSASSASPENAAGSGREAGTLRVTAPIGVEIEVSDGEFAKIANGSQTLQCELNPGVYFVKWSAAGRVESKTVSVRSGRTTDVRGGDFSLGSAPPYAAEKASSLEREQFEAVGKAIVGSPPGRDAEILIIVRSDDERPTSDVARSIRLADRQGDDMRSADHLSAEVADPARQLAVRRYKVPPGAYLIRYEASDRRKLEQTVYAFRDRQTICFLKYGSQLITENRVDGSRIAPRRGIVPGQSTFLSVPIDGALPDQLGEAIRFADILLHKIAIGESLVAYSLVETINAQDRDPYLKIYAAALLLQRTKGDADPANAFGEEILAPALINGLPGCAAAEKQCLRWRRAMLQGHPGMIDPATLDTPPMLDICWRWASEFSVYRDGPVGNGSLFNAAAQITETHLPWLVWRYADRTGRADLTGSDRVPAQNVEIQMSNLMAILRSTGALTSASLIGPVIHGVSAGTLEIANATIGVLSLNRDPSAKSNAQKLAFATGLPVNELSRQLDKSVGELESFALSEDGQTFLSTSS